jgi:hypothetical protein
MPPLFFLYNTKLIGVIAMKTVTKQDKKITITITYNNVPSQEAIRQYAQKLKHTIDSKMIAS